MLRDRIFESPIAFALGCFAWVPVAVWVMALFRWMVNGDIDVVLGTAGIVAAVLLGYVAINPPYPQLSILTFAALVGTIVLYPVVRAGMDRRSLRKLEVEDLERAYKMYSLRPDNVVAKYRIARKAFDLGYPGHAVRIAEQCLAEAPGSFFVEERRELQKWHRTHIDAKAFEPIPCVECGHANPPGQIHCARCGAPFLLDRARGRLLPGGLGRKLLGSWIVMVACLAGVPLLASFGGAVAGAGIFGLMVLALVVLVLSFWQSEPRSEGGAQ